MGFGQFTLNRHPNPQILATLPSYGAFRRPPNRLFPPTWVPTWTDQGFPVRKLPAIDGGSRRPIGQETPMGSQTNPASLFRIFKAAGARWPRPGNPILVAFRRPLIKSGRFDLLLALVHQYRPLHLRLVSHIWGHRRKQFCVFHRNTAPRFFPTPDPARKKARLDINPPQSPFAPFIPLVAKINQPAYREH